MLLLGFVLLTVQGIIIAGATKAPRPAYPTNQVGATMEKSPTWVAGALGIAFSCVGGGILFAMEGEREKQVARSKVAARNR